jgi:hypothetical protein
VRYYKQQDHDFDAVIDPLTTNCYGRAPWMDANGVAMDGQIHDARVDGTDYFDYALNTCGCDFGTSCASNNNAPACTDGIQTNRATELDYVRFLIGMTKQGMSLPMLMDVFAGSNRSSWSNANTGSNQPAALLYAGVVAFDNAQSPVTNFHALWSNEATLEGVQR